MGLVLCDAEDPEQTRFDARVALRKARYRAAIRRSMQAADESALACPQSLDRKMLGRSASCTELLSTAMLSAFRQYYVN
jgi:hypothetical protein